MGLGVFLVSVAVCCGVALYSLFSSQSYKVKRRLRAAPRMQVSELVDGGAARIAGTLRLGDSGAIEAPLSGRPCAYFEVIVETAEDRTPSGRREISREARGVPFEVDDGSGVRALVDPRAAEVTLVADVETWGRFDDPTPAEEALLTRHGHKRRGVLGKKQWLHFKEGILEEGETVAILGYATLEPDPEAVGTARGYRDAPAMRVRIGGSPDHPIFISDAPETL